MSASRAHIVSIDDDPDVHVAVRSILEPKGYRVTCFEEGRAALSAMRTDPPNMVLLDVMLASMSEGFHLLYEIRNDPLLKGIPVVMVSSVGRETGIDFAREVGTSYIPAEGFIEKPLDSAALLKKIAAVLGESPRLVAH